MSDTDAGPDHKERAGSALGAGRGGDAGSTL